MHYNITLQDLNKLNFDAKFKDIVINEPDIDFYSKPGVQHYRLLSYISTLFNNVNILDIGTHLGHSALALSYNDTNTIYSFDIMDKVRPSIKNVKNIKFMSDNLFDENIFNKYKDIIMNCPFIFLDVDPHNGFMEINFINMLQKNDYKGFIVCDDIWYFKDMRDNFWFKINNKYRYDITHLGHWSGTGIISFNGSLNDSLNESFNESLQNNNWTLVTAYFNLTKCPDASDEIKARSKEYYFSHSIATLSIPYNMVIYCDMESLDMIKNIRPKYLENNTKYIVKDFDKFTINNKDFSEYRNQIIQNRKEKPYHFDNRNTASYYLFCMSRYIIMKEAIENNYFNSTHFAWINFCIERMGFKNLIHLPEALSVNRDKFSTCYIDYITPELVFNTEEYFKWGRCGMCSGFFTGNKEYMYKVCDLIEKKFVQYVEEGYGHADEQLYSPVYFENPDLFEHYYGDYMQMITNYKYIYDEPDAPIRNIIRNSFNSGNYKECMKACNFLFNSWTLNKCELNNFNTFAYYYMNCKKNITYNNE